MHNIGHAFTYALAIPEIQFVIPGPETARHIPFILLIYNFKLPGVFVKYPIAPAAYAAPYSFLNP